MHTFISYKLNQVKSMTHHYSFLRFACHMINIFQLSSTENVTVLSDKYIRPYAMPFVIKLFQYQVPSLNYSTSSLLSHFIAQLFEKWSQHEKKKKNNTYN